MRILDRYIGKTLLGTTFIALLILIAVFVFFALVDQLEDSGRGHYGLFQVLEYVLLTIPSLAYDLFPIAAVIGSMTAVGILIRTGELTAIRAAGVSQMRIAYTLCKTGLLLVLLTIIIGELVAPFCEQTAQHRRSIALTEQIALKTKYGFWSRDGHSYINIRKILPGDRVEDIYIYEFDDQNRLFSSTHAKMAEYANGQWLLHDIVQSRISAEKVSRQRMELASWDALLNPEMINLVTVKPDYLSLWGLLDYIRYLRQNGQNSRIYEQALWSKIINPFSILAMILLALPIVKRGAETPAIGQKIFIGALIGIIFRMGNQAAGHLGVVYELSPAISVTMPTLVMMAIVGVLLVKGR